jgi:hypothetical protein
MLICDKAHQYKKCSGCNHGFPHEEVVIIGGSCTNLGQCGITEENIVVEAQCVPIKEE